MEQKSRAASSRQGLSGALREEPISGDRVLGLAALRGRGQADEQVGTCPAPKLSSAIPLHVRRPLASLLVDAPPETNPPPFTNKRLAHSDQTLRSSFKADNCHCHLRFPSFLFVPASQSRAGNPARGALTPFFSPQPDSSRSNPAHTRDCRRS